jgi:hypothetical protein
LTFDKREDKKEIAKLFEEKKDKVEDKKNEVNGQVKELNNEDNGSTVFKPSI